MKKIRYIGERPRVVDGKYMFKGDVRDVSDKTAETLIGTAGIVILGKAVAPKAQADLSEVVEPQIMAEPTQGIVVEPSLEVRAKVTPRNPRGRKK